MTELVSKFEKTLSEEVLRMDPELLRQLYLNPNFIGTIPQKGTSFSAKNIPINLSGKDIDGLIMIDDNGVSIGFYLDIAEAPMNSFVTGYVQPFSAVSGNTKRLFVPRAVEKGRIKGTQHRLGDSYNSPFIDSEENFISDFVLWKNGPNISGFVEGIYQNVYNKMLMKGASMYFEPKPYKLD